MESKENEGNPGIVAKMLVEGVPGQPVISDKPDFDGILRTAYGIPKNWKPQKLKDRLERWTTMSLLDIGKEMYGTIHTTDQRLVRDAYVKGLLHGQELQKYKDDLRSLQSRIKELEARLIPKDAVKRI